MDFIRKLSCLRLFELSNSVLAPNVLVYSMILESDEDGAEMHSVFDRIVWFCTLCNLKVELKSKLLRMEMVMGSAPLVL